MVLLHMDFVGGSDAMRTRTFRLIEKGAEEEEEEKRAEGGSSCPKKLSCAAMCSWSSDNAFSKMGNSNRG